MALKQLQQQNPTMYDPIAIDTAAMQAIGWSNPEQFMAPPQTQGQMPPQMKQAMAELQIKKQEADAKTMMAQAKAAQMQNEIQNGQNGQKPVDPIELARMQLEQQEMQQKSQDAVLDAINRKRDRESRERLAAVKLAEDMAANPQAIPLMQNLLHGDMINRLEANEPSLLPTTPNSVQ